MRLRKWIGWAVFGFVLIGLAFALDATLPPQPRCVMHGAFVPGVLSADGRMMTTGTREADAESPWCVSLKTWDTFTGRERGEFFKGLISPNVFEPPSGIAVGEVVYSPDRRFCALVHQRGMALADLASGREWPEAIKASDLKRDLASRWPPEAIALHRLLQQPMGTQGLQEEVKLKVALEYVGDKFAGKLPIFVNKEAFAEQGADAPDPNEEVVRLPPVPTKMTTVTALRIMLAQVGKGEATYLIRRDCVEITTMKRAREENEWTPAFSPRGSFVALLEGQPKRSMLHVVECATGQRLASLPLHADAYDEFGFTPDDETLYFFAAGNDKPLLTAWSTRTRQTARTFPEVALANGESAAIQVSPDGKSLLANTAHLPGGGLDLLDLSTGARRRLIDHAGKPGEVRAEKKNRPLTAFSSDGKVLVQLAEKELQTWDLPAGMPRAPIRFAQSTGPWRELAISADSRLCLAVDTEYAVSVWNIDTGKLLWRRAGPKFGYERFFSPVPDRRFLVEFTKGRMDILDHESGTPRATLWAGEHDDNSGYVLSTSSNGRSMLTFWEHGDDRPPSAGEKWLGKWWPFRRPLVSLVVAEVATGRTQLRVDVTVRPKGIQFSEDGRTLMTQSFEDKGTVLCFWDVPGQASRLWVFGIPAALAGVGVLLRWWHTRKKEMPPKAAAGT